MEDRRDLAIKLFGKTIQLLAVREVLGTAGEDGGHEKKVILLNCRKRRVELLPSEKKKWIFDAV